MRKKGDEEKEEELRRKTRTRTRTVVGRKSVFGLLFFTLQMISEHLTVHFLPAN